MAQTFLTDAEVDELVAVYQAGATLRGLAKQFHVHRLTAAAHLARRGVPLRRADLDAAQTKEAARLYARAAGPPVRGGRADRTSNHRTSRGADPTRWTTASA